MNSKPFTIAASGLFLLFTVSGLCQERKVIEFSGTAGPAADPATPNTHNPVRGVMQCVGADKTTPVDQDAPPWCPPGTRTVAKSRVVVGKWVTSDPNLNGTMRWHLNFDMDSSTLTGPWWGTFILEVPGKGTWEGSVWGEESGLQMTWRILGTGTGAFDGSTLMAEAYFDDYSSKPPRIKGRYLEPKTQ